MEQGIRPACGAPRGRGRARVGTLFLPETAVRELPEVAGRAEMLGFDEIWLAEDCFMHGGLTAAATVLALTQRIRVGVGLLPASTRNPATVAMELATLADLHPHRFLPAFGHGVESWMRQIGARPSDRITLLKEVVSATQALLSGETVTRKGRFTEFSGVQLEHPPAVPPPLYIGTTGKQGIAVARAAGAGLILPEGTSAGAVAWALEQLGGQGEVVVYAWLRLDDDGERARAAVLPAAQHVRARAIYPPIVRHWGLDDGNDIERELMRSIAIAGTAKECAEAVTGLHGAGAASVVLRPVGRDPLSQLDRFAQEVLPHLDSRLSGDRQG